MQRAPSNYRKSRAGAAPYSLPTASGGTFFNLSPFGAVIYTSIYLIVGSVVDWVMLIKLFRFVNCIELKMDPFQVSDSQANISI